MQRRHTAEFVLLMRGIFNRNKISDVIQHLTTGEAQLIHQLLTREPAAAWLQYQELAPAFFDPKYHDNLWVAWERILTVRTPILVALLTTDHQHNRLTWNWPKGRPEPGETSLQCALRELTEETGVDLGMYDLQVISTYLADRTTDSNRRLLHHITLVEVPYCDAEFDIQTDEVACAAWFDQNQLLAYHEHNEGDWTIEFNAPNPLKPTTAA